MTKFISGCMCAICFTVLAGCATTKKVEKLARHLLATEVDGYLENNKAKFLLEGCSAADKAYDELRAEMKKSILK